MPAQALFIDGTQATMQASATADDGNPATWPQAVGRYRWIQEIDLQQPQSISVISLLQPDDKFATNWHVDVSVDGSSFYTVARHADTAGGLSGVQLDHSLLVRYIRIIADRSDGGNQIGGQMAVSEIGIYSLQ
jgi:F5/8 type C domain